jgi:predicted nucleic acid-binding protein
VVVLDANLLIAIEKGNSQALQRIEGLLKEGLPLRVAAVAWVEYLAGVPLGRRHAAQADLDQTTSFEPFTRECAAVAVQLQSELLKRGARLAHNDLQIAATALHYDEPVVSNDKGFDAVPGLARLSF